MKILAGFILGLLLCGGLYLYDKMQPPQIAQLLPTTPKLAGEEKEAKKCETVMAFKPDAKKTLGLPEQIQKDEQSSVIAASPVPPSDYPRTATAVLHRDTGLGEIYLQQDSLPWLAFNKRNTVSVGYGLGGDSDITSTWHVGAQHQFMQTKAINLHLGGHLFGDGYKFVEVGGHINF